MPTLGPRKKRVSRCLTIVSVLSKQSALWGPSHIPLQGALIKPQISEGAWTPPCHLFGAPRRRAWLPRPWCRSPAERRRLKRLKRSAVGRKRDNWLCLAAAAETCILLRLRPAGSHTRSHLPDRGRHLGQESLKANTPAIDADRGQAGS